MCEPQVSHLFIADFDLGRVTVGVNGCFHDQSGLGRSVGNQVDNHFEAYQGAGSPVLGDEAEQPMFNLVPFAGSGWKVTDEYLYSGSSD